MLNNIIIKEIKNFEIYNSNDKLIRHKFSLTGVGLIHNNSSVAKLQGKYRGGASNESIECNTKLYKIKGKAVIQDVDTCGIYEGDFTANHVIFIKDDIFENELVMLLLKMDDEPMYTINVNASEDETKKDMPMCEREIEKDDVTNIETGANILMTDVLTNPTLKNIYLLNKSLDLLEIMRPKIKCGRNTNILALKKTLSACIQNFAENPNEENTDLIFKLKNLIKRFEA